MNKVTRPAFGGPSQFYSTTSQVCARRFETFLGLGFHLTGIFRINALYADKRLHNVKGGSTIVVRSEYGNCLPQARHTS
jgi:hypothetical protein